MVRGTLVIRDWLRRFRARTVRGLTPISCIRSDALRQFFDLQVDTIIRAYPHMKSWATISSGSLHTRELRKAEILSFVVLPSVAESRLDDMHGATSDPHNTIVILPQTHAILLRTSARGQTDVLSGGCDGVVLNGLIIGMARDTAIFRYGRLAFDLP